MSAANRSQAAGQPAAPGVLPGPQPPAYAPASPDGAPSLRVCHLGKYYAPSSGGIESHVRTLAHAQAELGARVQVFCINHQAGPTTHEQDGPVAVERFGRAASAAKLDVCPD